MITPYDHQHDEINAAMQMHLSTLHDAFFDFLAAIIAVLLGITSILHAVIRIAYAGIGLLIWTLGLWMIALQSLRAKCVARSSTSPFRKEVQDE